MRLFSYIFTVLFVLGAYGCGGSSNGSSPEVPSNEHNGENNNSGNEEGNGNGGGETIPVNRAPEVTVLKTSFNEDEVTTIAKAVDADNDDLTLEILTQPTLGTLYLEGTDIVYAPFDNQNGEDTVRFKVKDSENNVSNEVSTTLSIASVNDTPAAEDLSFQFSEDTSIAFELTGEDADVTDTLTVVITTFPLHGKLLDAENIELRDDVYLAPMMITFLPDQNFSSKDFFTYVVMDDKGTSSEERTVTFDVINDNAEIVLNPAIISEVTEQKKTLSLELATGECQSLRIVQQPQFGHVSLSGCFANYTATAAFENVIDDTFTFASSATPTNGTATIAFRYCGDGIENNSETQETCPIDFAKVNTADKLNAMSNGSVTSNNDFVATNDMTLAPGVYTFNNIEIPQNVTITTSGLGALVLRARGSIYVHGTIDLNGGEGQISNTEGHGGNTGNSGQEGQGGSGTKGSDSYLNSPGGSFGGGGGGEWLIGGGGGGGYFGGNGGSYFDQSQNQCYEGGAGANNAYSQSCTLVTGGSGGEIGEAAENDLRVASTFYAGSGGGGGTGGSNSDHIYGGGGGGGGGALRLVARHIQLTELAMITVNGGQGGNSSMDAVPEAESAGGGGSGGVIDLRALILGFDEGALISAAFGKGGTGHFPGGDGGNGRIRISTKTSSCNLSSANILSHALIHNTCTVSTEANFGEVYISQWPN